MFLRDETAAEWWTPSRIILVRRFKIKHHPATILDKTCWDKLGHHAYFFLLNANVCKKDPSPLPTFNNFDCSLAHTVENNIETKRGGGRDAQI